MSIYSCVSVCVCVCVCVCGENVYFLTIEYLNDDVLDFNIKFTITVTRGGGKGGQCPPWRPKNS